MRQNIIILVDAAGVDYRPEPAEVIRAVCDVAPFAEALAAVDWVVHPLENQLDAENKEHVVIDVRFVVYESGDQGAEWGHTHIQENNATGYGGSALYHRQHFAVHLLCKVLFNLF